MTIAERRDSPVRRQVEAYEESWQKDHLALGQCWACEDTIAVGLATGMLLERVDRSWRDRVFRGVEDYSAEADDLSRTLFRVWLRVTASVLDQAARLEKEYGTVEGASELRQAEERIRVRLDEWQAPRLSRAVGLREMTLSPEAAAQLDQVLQQTPPPLPARPPMQEMSADELKRGPTA
jgi:hypothetical protein